MENKINKKIIYISAAVFLFLLALVLYWLLYSVPNMLEGTIRPLSCFKGDGALKNIPCSGDADCTIEITNDYCGGPEKVARFDCGFRDFCGDDGYCKHDCSLR